MDNFLDRYHIPKFNQDQTYNFTRHITCKKIEAIIKGLATKKSPKPNGFRTEFYQNFKEELIPKLLKLFHIIKNTRNVPKLILRGYYYHDTENTQSLNQKSKFHTNLPYER